MLGFDPRRDAQVAQLVEHAIENRSVAGSIPALGTIFFNGLDRKSNSQEFTRGTVVTPRIKDCCFGFSVGNRSSRKAEKFVTSSTGHTESQRPE